MWLLYQLTYLALLLLAGPLLLVSRGRHYLRTLSGRLGLDPGVGEARPGALWIHAVSVGEVAVAATLARALPEELPLLVTTITPTGQARARALFGPGSSFAGRAAVAYLPFELGFAVRRLLDRHRPRGLVLVEGDYWPLLLSRVRRRGLPVVVVNGRVGDASFRRMRRLRPLARRLLAQVDRFGVQSGADRDKLAALGVPPGRVTVTGNLKYDAEPPPRKPGVEAALARLAAGRPILVAGSTMAGEEERVLDAFAAAGGGRAALLVLAPRHPERWDEVERLLERRGVAAVRRSGLGVGAAGASGTGGPPGEDAGAGSATDGEPSPDELPAVVLLDTLGELAGLYAIARGAFVGGTLVPTGGHNPLEPALFAVPIAVGPSMENFRPTAADFDRADAWRRVADARELGRVWEEWIADPASAEVQGRRGRQVVAEGRGALGRTLALLPASDPEPETGPGGRAAAGSAGPSSSG